MFDHINCVIILNYVTATCLTGAIVNAHQGTAKSRQEGRITGARVTSLVCVELTRAELDLFSGLERRHAEVRTTCTAERVAQVTLQQNTTLLI